MSDSTNLDRLTSKGIIPEGYDGLSDAEKAAIEGLSGEEVDSIISASNKIHGEHPEFLKRHAPHGMSY